MTTLRHGLRALVTGVLFAAAFPSQAALVLGQTNTFQDLTTDGWFAGGLGPPGQHPPVPPQVVANGGPGGAGDAFLQITGTGALNAPGGRVVAIGGTQWAGNYSALAPVAIAMDLRNLGQNPLTVRLLLEDPQGGPPSDEGVTTLGISLPVGGPWQHAQFLINPGALTMLDGSANALLANTTLLRIIHSPTAADAVDIAGVLGVDNITLVRPAQVPSPGTLPLLAAGLALLVRFTRAHRTKDAAD